MKKHLKTHLVFLFIIILALSSSSYFTTQQDTYLVAGIVTLECVARDKEVIVILKNTHSKEFVIYGVETKPNETLGITLPQTLRPESITYLTLRNAEVLSRVSVRVRDPETNVSIVMTCFL